MSDTIIRTDWEKCYGEAWADDIVKKSVSHPAKFSRRLIVRIYQHALERGWLRRGDTVLDPFGGVALGAFGALLNGVNWIGCELESRFAALGRENIERWSRRFSGGKAILLHGDSRHLAALLSGADVSISSPPFFQTPGGAKGINVKGYGDGADKIGERTYQAKGGERQADNLEILPEGSIEATISSPPYATIATGAGGLNTKPASKPGQQSGRNPNAESQDTDQKYGTTDGQLSRMAEGEIAATISSPPYENSLSTGQSGIDWGKAGRPERATASPTRQGVQGAAGHEMRYSAAVSSPPYENSLSSERNGIDWSKTKKDYPGRVMHKDRIALANEHHSNRRYSPEKDNLGNQAGDTFWSAARQIVEQVFLVLKPGGVAVWVTKNYVRNRKEVDFNLNWQRLCESVGFRTIEVHRAMQVEHRGEQPLLTGEVEVIKLEFKGFFRRNAEAKGSPPIDYEAVLCMRKPSA